MTTNSVFFGIIVALIVLLGLLTAVGTIQPRVMTQQPRIAILPFNNLTGVQGMDEGLSQLLTAELQRTLRYQVIEPGAAQKVLQDSGLLGKTLAISDALGIGRAVNADYVLLGTVTKISLGENTLELDGDLQVVRTDQGTVVFGHAVQGQVAFQGINVTASSLLQVTFYDQGQVADLLRKVSVNFAHNLVDALAKTF